jgi:hypothetical protein
VHIASFVHNMMIMTMISFFKLCIYFYSYNNFIFMQQTSLTAAFYNIDTGELLFSSKGHNRR